MKVISSSLQEVKYSTWYIKTDSYVFKLFQDNFTVSTNLYREWKIWSQCFGDVIVINGPSSSGKTTYGKYLSGFGFNLISLDDIFYESYFRLMCDSGIDKHLQELLLLAKKFILKEDLSKLIDGFEIDEKKYIQYEIQVIKAIQSNILKVTENTELPSFIQVMSCLYNNAKEFLFSGRNVVVDVLFPESSSFDMLSFAFHYYPMTNILLYSSLEDNLKKCFQRNYQFIKEVSDDYRYPSQVISQYSDFYEFISERDLNLKSCIGAYVDIKGLKQVLGVVEYCQYNLTKIIQQRGIKELITFDNEQILKDATNKLSVLIKGSSDYLLVAAKVKYDYIINSAHLTKIYSVKNALVSKTALDIKDFIRNFVSDANTQALIYKNDKTLPSIIGSNGRVVEYEMIDGMLNYLGEQETMNLLEHMECYM